MEARGGRQHRLPLRIRPPALQRAERAARREGRRARDGDGSGGVARRRAGRVARAELRPEGDGGEEAGAPSARAPGVGLVAAGAAGGWAAQMGPKTAEVVATI